MKDMLALFKVMVLSSLLLYCKTVSLENDNNTCLNLLNETDVPSLFENFYIEVEAISDSITNSLNDMKSYLLSIKDSRDITLDTFTFTEQGISCKASLIKITENTMILKRQLTTCIKKDQCHNGSDCIERFEDGVQLWNLATDGSCVNNICQLASDSTKKYVLTKNRDLSRNNSGKCQCSSTSPLKCLDTDSMLCITGTKDKINKQDKLECAASKKLVTDPYPCATNFCYDSEYKCVATSSTNKRNGDDGECYSHTCDLTQHGITADTNKLDVQLNVSGTDVQVLFEDPDNILSSAIVCDGDTPLACRYYSQVYLTDSKGNFKGDYPDFIKGTQLKNAESLTPVSITVTKAQITANCDLVDSTKAYLGRKCYFMAIVADTCSYLKDLMVYTHLAERIFNIDGAGIYVVEEAFDVASQFEDLRIDYCSYVKEDCYLSTDYIYTASFCKTSGTTCATTLSDSYKFKRDETVHVKIRFQTESNSADVTGKSWDLISVKTKLYTIDGKAIDTDERDATTTVTNETSLNSYLYFDFDLSPDLLFYDDETLVSNVLKLLIVVKVTNSMRLLEVNLNATEIVPQLGSLLRLTFDDQDLQEYKSLTNNTSQIIIPTESDNNKKVIIAVVCSVVGFLLICLGIILYLCVFKKQNPAVIEVPVNQISTMGDKVEPEQIQIQEAEINNN
jgi:hypothetical protein